MNKGFIFDLDGVIVDTAKYHFSAWRRLADELDITFTETDNERLKGVSRMRSLDILLALGRQMPDEDTKLKLAAKKNAWYVEFVNQMTPADLLPGAESFLKASKQQGIKIALGSASKNALTIVEKLSLDKLFDAIIDGNKVANAKPDPEVFIKGAGAIGVKPEACVVFEDAEAGIEAAINAGMKCVGIGDASVLGKANLVVDGLAVITVEQAMNL
jgi:beta-phosphoglucomutase